jgi:hypothetical protein
VKNHDFTPKNHIFSNFKGGARRVRPPPWIRPWSSSYLQLFPIRPGMTQVFIRQKCRHIGFTDDFVTKRKKKKIYMQNMKN